MIIQKGGNPLNPATCKTNPGGQIAITVFNGGLAEFRNADICGKIEPAINSSLRIDDAGGEIIGNVEATLGSFVRIIDRSNFGDGRLTTFDGTLTCSGGSQTFGGDVKCGQTCSGAIPGSCPAVPQSAANAVLRAELTGVGLSAASVDFLAPSDAIAAAAP